jgi:carbon storage regulator CsrA
VIEVTASGVRLGFEAPPEISIYREEIHVEIARANRAAATATEGEAAALK